MCGITFIANKKNEAVEPSIVERANNALRHRGPDDSSSLHHNNVALGHTRLSIVDIQGGKQPFFSEDRTIALVCNGEIYNYQELTKELQEKGHQFASRCDAEVIVHLYEEDPENYISQLQGMFAFVLLDMKKNTVKFGRDRLGMKPLYLYRDNSVFVLSSEIKAIFATGLSPKELNPEAIYDSFTFHYIPGERSSFKNISQFPPSMHGTLDLESFELKQDSYWEPTFPKAGNKGSSRFGHFSRELRRCFERSVQSHTIGDLPVASYLSGGIDSTYAAAVLNNTGEKRRLSTFSVKFSDPTFDESEVFNKTAELCNFDSNVLHVDKLSAKLFSDVIYHIEQPQFSPIDAPMFLLSEMVRDSGTKVVFSGEGSDELFGGYLLYTLNQIRRALSIPAVQSFRPMLLDRSLGWFLGQGDYKKSLLNAYNQEAAPVVRQFGTYPAWFPTWQAAENSKKVLFKDKYRCSYGEGSSIEQISRPLHGKYQGISDFDKSIYLELKTRLPNYILLHSDRISMAHSVEMRLPYLSNPMIDFSLTIPPLFKLFGLKEKFILRSAAKNVVPKHVLSRRKKGFSAPNSWLWSKDDDELSNHLLSEDYLKKTGLFDIGQIKKHRSTLLSGNLADLSSEKSRLSQEMTGVLSTQMLQYRLIDA